jgi:hypothetical protein
MPQPGFWIAEGWMSQSQMYEYGEQITAFPTQSDMNSGRRWVRPGNTADIVRPVRFVDSPTGQRWGYGGLTFTWPMQALSPKMVQYLQTTYFSPSSSPATFYHRGWSNKLTVQTYNRASGEWEAYQCFGRFANFEGEAEPATGGYNNLQLIFTAYLPAPNGPDLQTSVVYPTTIYEDDPFEFTVSIDNIGDIDTEEDITITYALPTEFYFQTISTAADSTIEYSVDDGATWSETPPGDLTTVTNVRVIYEEVIPEGGTSEDIVIGVIPNTFNPEVESTVEVTMPGEADDSNNNVTTELDILEFVPLAYEGVLLWLSAGAEVFSDGGSDLLANNGETVDEWRDQSPNFNHAVQNTGTNKPTYLTNQQDGKPALQFNTDDFMTLSFTNSSTPLSGIFMIDADNSGSGSDSEYLMDIQTGRLVFAHIDGEATFEDDNGILRGTTWGRFTDAISGLQRLHFESATGTGMRLWRNNVSQTLTGGSTGNSAIGGDISIASDNSGTGAYFNGLIYEIILYNRVLTTTERDRIDQYFVEKYDL